MKVRTYERVMTDEARVCQGGKRYMDIRDAVKKKKRDFLGIFPNFFLNSQNFCKFTKFF